MFNIIKRRSTHSGRLERWLGKDECERISAGMRDWYGPDIAVAATPGLVYARKGGDFVGRVDGGWFSNLVDTAEAYSRALARRQSRCFNAGFADLADLQFEATKGGKLQSISFQKAFGNSVGGTWADHWNQGTFPAAGASGGAAPGGTAWTSASTGALALTNPNGTDTAFFVGGDVRSGGVGCGLLYDRLFSVAKTMNSTATEAVTGVPTRYQSQTSTDADYIGGNFAFPTSLTTIAATAHNWTVCTYTDQSGNASTFPSVAGRSSSTASTLDLTTLRWFIPLEAGDVGVGALTQMQCDAAVATGTIDFTIGHPIAWLPTLASDVSYVIDAINSAFQINQIMPNAALAFIGTGSGGYQAGGSISVVSG